MFWFFKHQFDGEGFPLGPKPTERLPTYRYPFFHIVLEHRLMLRLGVHKLAAVPDGQTLCLLRLSVFLIKPLIPSHFTGTMPWFLSPANGESLGGEFKYANGFLEQLYDSILTQPS